LRFGWGTVPSFSGTHFRPRGPVGPSFAVGKSRGVGRRTTHIYFSGAFRRPRGSLRRRPFGLHPCSPRPIAPERSAFIGRKPPLLSAVGSPAGTRPGSSF